MQGSAVAIRLWRRWEAKLRNYFVWRRWEAKLRNYFRPRAAGPRIVMVRGSAMAGEMAKVLRRYGLNVDMVERPALTDYARRTQPALIVSDLSVSGMSEMEDALHLRQLLPASKVMMFSGQGLHPRSIPRDSEVELVRTIERLCTDPQSGYMLWLDLARFVQAVPRRRSMAA